MDNETQTTNTPSISDQIVSVNLVGTNVVLYLPRREYILAGSSVIYRVTASAGVVPYLPRSVVFQYLVTDDAL